MIRITRTPNADTRTATGPISKDVLLASSKEHIRHVRMGLEFFMQKLASAAGSHDWTKIAFIDEFAADAATGKVGDEFKSLLWFHLHITEERHHIKDRCPDDVNLIDLLERIADIVMAGLSRSGTVHEDEISAEILQRAYKNTIELLKANVEVLPDNGAAR